MTTINCLQDCMQNKINQTALEAGIEMAKNNWSQYAIIIGIAIAFFLTIVLLVSSTAVSGKKATKRSKRLFWTRIFIPFMLYIITTAIFIIFLLPRYNIWLYS